MQRRLSFNDTSPEIGFGRMCESAVYTVKGSVRTLVMQETARILVDGRRITCVDNLGMTKTVDGFEIAEANLIRHEVLLRERKG